LLLASLRFGGKKVANIHLSPSVSLGTDILIFISGVVNRNLSQILIAVVVLNL